MVFIAGMIPPDRSMFKTPGSAKTASAPAAELSTFEKILRYAEKDDWLLYMTALFGILMPGIMYFLYRKAHIAYLEYSNQRARQKRDQKKKIQESSKRPEMTIFYCGTGTMAKKVAYEAAERLEDVDPLVVKLAGTDLSGFIKYKGICLFVVGIDEHGTKPQECEALFEWLSSTTDESKKKPTYRNILFSTISISKTDEHVESARDNIDAFKKHFHTVGSHELCDSVACSDDQVKDNFDVWMTEIRYTAKRMGLMKQPLQKKRRGRKPSVHSDGSCTESEQLYTSDESDHEKYD